LSGKDSHAKVWALKPMATEPSSRPPVKKRRPPFVIAYKAILRRHQLSHGARLLLLIIKSYADASGLYCYPSRETLAKDLGSSVATVKRLIRELRKAKIIISAQRSNRDGTKSTTSYLLDDEPLARLFTTPKKHSKQGVTSDPRLGSPVTHGEAPKIIAFTEENRASA